MSIRISRHHTFPVDHSTRCSVASYVKETITACREAVVSGTAEGEGLAGLKPYHFLAWVKFLGSRINTIVCKCVINGGNSDS